MVHVICFLSFFLFLSGAVQVERQRRRPNIFHLNAADMTLNNASTRLGKVANNAVSSTIEDHRKMSVVSVSFRKVWIHKIRLTPRFNFKAEWRWNRIRNIKKVVFLFLFFSFLQVFSLSCLSSSSRSSSCALDGGCKVSFLHSHG